MREALSEAIAGNPSLEASRSRIEQAAAQRKQAGLSPNPRLYLQTEDVRWWGNPAFSYWRATEDYAYLGQVFESGGKRARRVGLATADLQGTQLQEDLFRRQIRARVITSYWAAEGAAQVRTLYEQYLQTYQDDFDYISNRVKEGVLAEVDLMRIGIERDRVRVQAMNAARDYDQAIVELYRAIGRPDFPPTVLTDSPESSAMPPVPDLNEALSARLEKRIAQQAVVRAEANLKLQHANAKPDPEAYAGYKRDVGYDTLYAALQIDLPLRNRNQGNIGSAEAELEIARSNLRLTETNIKADLTSALRTYNDERQTADRLASTRAAVAETVRLARAAYREGGIDLLRLLDAERSRIDFEIQYLQSLTLLKQSIVNLQVSAGSELQP